MAMLLASAGGHEFSEDPDLERIDDIEEPPLEAFDLDLDRPGDFLGDFRGERLGCPSQL